MSWTTQVHGAQRLALAILREPRLVRRLPRWLREARDRNDPLLARRPWWNYDAIDFVDGHLRPDERVFEYGGGASTLWLIDKGCAVTTIEHDPAWYESLAAVAPDTVRFVAADESFDEYVATVSAEPDNSLDLVIIDGRERVRCGLSAAPKVKPGGMLLLDDSDRPQYRRLHNALRGWRANHLRGLKTGDWVPRQTTVWIKPQSTT